MNGPYEDEPPPEGRAPPEDGVDPDLLADRVEPDSPGRRAGWLARMFLILLAMAMVPWLVEQCQDPDRRLPVRDEAPPVPDTRTP